MSKQLFHRITALLLLGFLLAPISIQFIHATEKHTFNEKFSDGLDHIQNIEKDCAIYHHQINHNAVDLYFDFKIDVFPVLNRDIQIVLTEIHQNYTNQKSSRAPPVSFV
ncbi:MAG: hypothetical protein ABFR05_10815 [Bacteroidota bacterium]